MSGRSASVPRPRFARTAVAAGLIVGCVLTAAATAAAQPPDEPSAVDQVDSRPPIPPEQPKRAELAAKYRIDKDRAIYKGIKDKNGNHKGGIADNTPLASEKQNPDEYQALTAVVLHAFGFPAAELEQHAARDLTPDDLTQLTRESFRLDLIRFDGKLTKARRVPATKALEATGIKELYEAWLVPADESPANPVCFLLTDWAKDLPAVPEITPGQPAGESVTIDRWAAIAGYSLKLAAFPGPGADPKDTAGPGWRRAPLLIGKAPTPLPGPPVGIPIDKGLRVFSLIQDDARYDREHATWAESTAWIRVLLHARNFTAEQLEAAARRGVTFADLFKEHRLDYQFELVYVRGRLIRLWPVPQKPTDRLPELLNAAGVPAVYEGWLVPDGEPRGNPLCVNITDLPPGLEPNRLMSVPVRFTGYSFKLMRYESGEQDPKNPKKNVTKRAPLLIGRSVGVLVEPEDGTSSWATTFVPAVIGTVVVLAGAALGMGWWFRRGDRQARSEIEATRKNPFGE